MITKSIICSILFIVFLASMRHMRKLSAAVPGERILDLRFGYGYSEVVDYMNSLSKDAIAKYKTFQNFDFMYIAIYIVFYAVTIFWLVEYLNAWSILVTIPIIAGACDLTENLTIRSMMHSNIKNQSLIMASSICTKIKFICAYTSMILVATLSAVAFYIKVIQ